MNNDKKWLLLNKIFYVVCIGVIFIVCLWNIDMQQRIRIVDDEFAYWGIAAEFAGLDWSGALSKTGYYSYGYSFVLVPLYWLIRAGLNVIVAYRIAIALNAVFMCLSFCLAVAIGKRVFSEINISIIQAAALIAVLYIGNVKQCGSAWTEVYLSFMFWCCFYSVVRVVEKLEIKWILLTLITAANLFAIHMRTLGVVIVVAAIVLLRLLASKDKIRTKKILIAIFSVCILTAIVLCIRAYVKNNIYMNNSAMTTNDFSGQTAKVQMLFSASGLVDFFFSVCGKLFYLGAATFCLGFFSVFVFLKKFTVEWWRYFRKRVERLSDNFFVYLFLFGAVAGAIGVDALFKIFRYYYSHLTYILPDAIVYGRYVDFVIGPLIFCGILLMYKEINVHIKELLLSIFVLIGCGMATQYMWDILMFYNGKNLGLRGTAIPGITHMISGNLEKAAYTCIVWAIGGLGLLLFAVLAGKTSKKRGYLLTVLCCVAVLYASALGNAGIEGGIKGKAHKEKNVSTITRMLEVLEDEAIYYVTNGDSVSGDMKILQWELPKKTIQLLEKDETSDIYMFDKNAVYLADSEDHRLNALLNNEGVYLYDSGTLSVYVVEGSEIEKKLEEEAKEAKSFANPKTMEVDLSIAVAEYAYQKANGSIYLSDQRMEDYLTWNTGMNLEDGIYQFRVDLEMSYYEGGNIGYITLTNTEQTYVDTRVLEESDFDEDGNAQIIVEMPIKDFEEPIVGVYTSGNGAMKLNKIHCVQKKGNLSVELGRENEWKELTSKLKDAYEQEELPIWYVDTDSSAKTGFPDFSNVDEMCPEKISNYCTGEQLQYIENRIGAYLIIERGQEECVSFEETEKIAESEKYIVYRWDGKLFSS